MLALAPAAEARERIVVSWGHGHGRGWDHGHWVHDRHDGRLGWWWVTAPGAWAYYERPYFRPVPQTVIVQESAPQPPVTIVQAAPPLAPVYATPAPSPVLYYCKATGTHYPETLSCPGGWLTMTAETPPAP